MIEFDIDPSSSQPGGVNHVERSQFQSQERAEREASIGGARDDRQDPEASQKNSPL